LPLPGWGLIGASGRYYFVGGLAVADYVRGGQRQIVPLIEEDPASHSRPDSNFLYYREQATGNRWAIRCQAAADRRFSIYFQPADAPGTWQLFQRALGSWDEMQAVNDAGSPYFVEPTCEYSHPDSGLQFFLY
jgi:hypothetical protein